MSKEAVEPASAKRKYMLVGCYLTASLAEMYFNRYIYEVMPFPFTLSAVHQLVILIGSFLLYKQRVFTLSKLTSSEEFKLVLFSILNALSIIFGLQALNGIAAPQVFMFVRPLAPFIVIILDKLVDRSSATTHASQTFLSLLIIVLVTWFGLTPQLPDRPSLSTVLLAITAVVIVSARTVMMSRVQTGKMRVSPVELLFRTTPVTFGALAAVSFFNGELATMSEELNSGEVSIEWSKFGTVLLANGCMAFAAYTLAICTAKHAGAMYTSVVSSQIKPTLMLLILAFSSKAIASTPSLIQILCTAGVLAASLYLSKLEFLDTTPLDPNMPLPATYYKP